MTLLADLRLALTTEYGAPRPETHVSDITLCPRKVCFQKLSPKALSNKDLNYFTSGKAIHAALQSLVLKYPDRYEIEYEVKYKDILIGHIDIYNKQSKIVIEAKSMRVAKCEAPKPHHIAQIKAYMAITGSQYGILFYQLLLNYDDDPFREFEVSITNEERKRILEQLEQDVYNLEYAIDMKDPSKARTLDLADDGFNWLCNSCSYINECLAIRNKK